MAGNPLESERFENEIGQGKRAGNEEYDSGGPADLFGDNAERADGRAFAGCHALERVVADQRVRPSALQQRRESETSSQKTKIAASVPR